MKHAPPDMRAPPSSKLSGVAGNKSRHAESAICSSAPLQSQAHCEHCGAALPHAAVRRRPRRFCSARCKQASFREFRNTQGNGPSDPASPLQGTSAALSARLDLPHVDVLGGHHRGAVDSDLRLRIILAEIGGAALVADCEAAFDTAQEDARLSILRELSMIEDDE